MTQPGFPQQNQPPAFPQQVAQPAPPPVFNVPGIAQPEVQPAEGSLAEKVDALLQSHQDIRNQVAGLTAAVNGLGQNTEALHNWLVAQVETVVAMVSSVFTSIKTQGVVATLTNVLTGGQPPQPPQG